MTRIPGLTECVVCLEHHQISQQLYISSGTLCLTVYGWCWWNTQTPASLKVMAGTPVHTPRRVWLEHQLHSKTWTQGLMALSMALTSSPLCWVSHKYMAASTATGAPWCIAHYVWLVRNIGYHSQCLSLGHYWWVSISLSWWMAGTLGLTEVYG